MSGASVSNDQSKVKRPTKYPINSVLSASVNIHGGKRMPLTYRGRWFRNKGAALVLSWGFLASMLLSSFIREYVEDPKIESKYNYFIILSIGSIFMPLIGWITDVYFSRYKIIKRRI